MRTIANGGEQAQERCSVADLCVAAGSLVEANPIHQESRAFHERESEEQRRRQPQPPSGPFLPLAGRPPVRQADRQTGLLQCELHDRSEHDGGARLGDTTGNRRTQSCAAVVGPGIVADLRAAIPILPSSPVHRETCPARRSLDTRHSCPISASPPARPPCGRRRRTAGCASACRA